MEETNFRLNEQNKKKKENVENLMFQFEKRVRIQKKKNIQLTGRPTISFVTTPLTKIAFTRYTLPKSTLT